MLCQRFSRLKAGSEAVKRVLYDVANVLQIILMSLSANTFKETDLSVTIALECEMHIQKVSIIHEHILRYERIEIVIL